MFEVNVTARSIDPFAPLVGADRLASVHRLAQTIRAAIGHSAVWNLNSTATGGGVAEMLRSLLRYVRDLDVQARWAVVEGPPEFFRITKRLHNALHDTSGDGSPLGPTEAAIYERVMSENMDALATLIRPGDVVICHDPQTAGLVPHLVRANVPVVWRCHIGHEQAGFEVDRGWAFLRRYLDDVPYAVFSRGAYAPGWMPHKRAVVLPPNIDPFSAKNQSMDEATARAILFEAGLVGGTRGSGEPFFLREDGSTGRVDRRAEIARIGGPPDWYVPIVVQVSRWDMMKDPIGVLRGFVRLLETGNAHGAHLVLAGPSMRGVADDPEGPLVYRAVEHAWRSLPPAFADHVHLAQLPMEDTDENAAIVNALQRHAAIIVQKSLREGFGLTVTEAMWKRRPVVASAVGGIKDQIRDGIDGLLVHDPTDVDAFAGILRRVLADDELARRLGDAAFERVRDHYLSIASLEHWAELLRLLLSERQRPALTA